MLENAVRLLQYAQGVGSATRRTDRSLLRRLRRIPGALCIFDVGANRGQYLQAAFETLQGRELSIHSFEPGSAAFGELERQFGDEPRVKLNRFGLGRQAGRQTLHFDEPGSQLASLYRRRLPGFDRSEEVRIETLDSYCQAHEIGHIHLLKLDAEGHELPILLGAEQTFARQCIEMVAFEFGGCNIDSRTFVRDFWDFFAGHDMKLARVTALGRLQPIPCYRESLEQFRITCFVAQRTASAQNSV